MGKVIKLETAKLADEIDIHGMRSDDLRDAIEKSLYIIEKIYQDEDLVHLVNNLVCWSESEAFSNGLAKAKLIFKEEADKSITRIKRETE